MAIKMDVKSPSWLLRAELIALLLVLCLYGSAPFLWLRETRNSATDILCDTKLQGVIALLEFSSIIGFVGHRMKKTNKCLAIGNRHSWLLCTIFIGAAAYFSQYQTVSKSTHVITWLGSIALGLGFGMVSNKNSDRVLSLFAGILLMLLLSATAFSANSHNFLFKYRNHIRWSGLWDNPNFFGLLMGTGLMLAVGLALGLGVMRSEKDDRKWEKVLFVALCSLAAVDCGYSLLRSYSRGAWVATFCASVYLVLSFSFSVFSRWILKNLRSLMVIIIAVGVLSFWQFRFSEWLPTQRVVSMININDFSWRNRAAAYDGALEMMADRSCVGFGWNLPEDTYQSFYLAQKPFNGQAIEMNDYLILGSSLGIPALFCFGMYLWLSLADARWKLGFGGKKLEAGNMESRKKKAEMDWFRATCRSGAIVLAIGFWFDGGLFKLATASTFWILLELGNVEATNGHEFTPIGKN